MKTQKVMALLLSTVLSFSACVPMTGMAAYGAETAVTAEAAAEEVSDSAALSETGQEADAFEAEETETSLSAQEDEETAASEESDEDSETKDPADEGKEADAASDTESFDTDTENEQTADAPASPEETSEDAEKEGAEDSAPYEESREGESSDTNAVSSEDKAADSDFGTSGAYPEESSSAAESASEDKAADSDSDTAEAYSEESSFAAESASEDRPAESAADTPEDDSTIDDVPSETETVKTDAQRSLASLTSADFANAQEINAGDSFEVTISEENAYVLYRFVPEETKPYSFYSSDDSGDPYAALYDEDRELISRSDDDGSGLNFKIQQVFNAGSTFYFQACLLGSGTGSFTVHLEEDAFYCLREGDYSRNIPLGTQETLTVNAYSTSQIAYQWYFNDTLIDGADSASYTFTATQAGTYSCHVADEEEHSGYCSFHVSIDNSLTAYPEGGGGSSSQYLYVAPGESTELNVIVSAADDSDLTYTWYDSNYHVIEGADSTSYTTGPVTSYQYYEFNVSDQYGNSRRVYFYIYVKNGLTAYPEGSYDIEDTYKDIYVAPGESAELNVIVSATDESALTYTWYDSNGMIEGADSTSYTTGSVTSYQYYRFNVSDQYGNSRQVYFYVYVENGLTAYPEGDYEGDNYKDIYVAPGESAELNVIVSATDESALTYTWYDSNDDVIEGVNSSSFTTGPVTSRQYYEFNVRDQYENSRSVYFYIYVQNDLTAYPEGNVGSSSKYLYVAPGESAELNVIVSAADESALTYTWYDSSYHVIEGADSTSYTTGPVTSYQYYRFNVSDQYGNSRWVYFRVYVENGLTAYPEDDDEGDDYKYIYVAPGESAELNVIVSATDDSALTYTWYDSNGMIEGADSASFTTGPVTSRQYYEFNVRDQYGNSRWVYFYVYVENDLTAYPEGNYEGNNYKDIYVAPGESAELNVIVSAADKSALTYTWYDSNYDVIEGADSASLTIGPVTSYQYYRFNVQDQYGNSRWVYFYIYADNNLNAYPAGSDEYDDSKSVHVIPGGSAELEVTVTAADTSALTRQWYRQVYQEEEDWYEYVEIEGANADSYTVDSVTENQRYRFRVTDQYGNEDTVYFYIYADNNLNAYPAGSDEYDGSKSVHAIPGGSAELEVTVTAADTSALTRQWYREVYQEEEDWYEYVEIEGANTDSYTVGSVTEDQTYRFRVTDQYGNEDTVYFYVYPDNGLAVYAEDDYFNVSPGGSAQMTAVVSAIDASSLTCRWEKATYDPDDDAYVYETVSGAESTSYTADNLTERATYRLCVSDQYGNSRYAWFHIYIETHLSLEAVGETERAVERGGSEILRVAASADEGTELTYQWYDESADADLLSDSTDPVSCTIQGLNGCKRISCTVRDQYGNSSSVRFYLYPAGKPPVYPGGGRTDSDSVTKYFSEGWSELYVNSFVYTGSLTYEWYDDETNVLLEEGISWYEFEMGRDAREIRCHVAYKDDPDSCVDLYFHVKSNAPTEEDFAGARTISVGTITPISLTSEKLFEIFKFVPDETAEYTFYSSDNEGDPYSELYDSSFNRFDYNDDGGGDLNFSLTQTLEAGTTWYLRVRSYSIGSASSYRLHLIKNGQEPEPYEEQVISAEDLSLIYGTTGTIDVSGAQGTLSFSSSNSGIASVDSSGKVTAKSVGTAVITVSAAATDTCLAAEDIQVTVTVTPASIAGAKVTVSESDLVYDGNAKTPSVTVVLDEITLTLDTDYTVTYENNTNAGTATITVTGKGNYTNTAETTFEIKAPETVAVTGLTLNRSSANIAATKTLQLVATVTPSNATDQTITWTSSDTSIATVDKNGLVKAKKYGTATITAKSSNGKTAKCKVSVLFVDVANSGKSYFTPVYWAVDKGITVVSVNFRPEDSVTRGEFVAFLWRLAGKPKSTAKVNLKDVNSKTKFYDAIRWAVGKGIIKGYSDGTFKSENNVTRGETATMIWRYAGKKTPKTKKSPFSDIKASTSDSYKAILWGSENGIIKGSGGKFLKNDGCTRGQVVTFLYRYSN